MDSKPQPQAPTGGAQRVALAGMAALKSGNAREAHAHFSQLDRAGLADSSVYLGLAIASHKIGLTAEAHRAVTRGLELDSDYVPLLVFRGDLASATGDARSSISFYQGALEAAERRPSLPPEFTEPLARARSICAQNSNAIETIIRQRLSAANVSPRFAESLDLLFGKVRVFLSSPRYFYFPQLASTPFHSDEDRCGQYQWMAELELYTSDIREELLKLQEDKALFSPYVERVKDRVARDKAGMEDNADWTACYLWKNGTLNAEVAARCPRTMKALECVPLVSTSARSPSVLFSVLQPGAHIPAHCGLVNTRLIGHLPLIVPPQCRFRVGNDIREWKEGKAWLFDDSIEHEAWNDSALPRTILIFEVWRPELSAVERDAVCKLFEAIDAQSGQPPQWQI